MLTITRSYALNRKILRNPYKPKIHVEIRVEIKNSVEIRVKIKNSVEIRIKFIAVR